MPVASFLKMSYAAQSIPVFVFLFKPGAHFRAVIASVSKNPSVGPGVFWLVA